MIFFISGVISIVAGILEEIRAASGVMAWNSPYDTVPSALRFFIGAAFFGWGFIILAGDYLKNKKWVKPKDHYEQSDQQRV